MNEFAKMIYEQWFKEEAAFTWVRFPGLPLPG